MTQTATIENQVVLWNAATSQVFLDGEEVGFAATWKEALRVAVGTGRPWI